MKLEGQNQQYNCTRTYNNCKSFCWAWVHGPYPVSCTACYWSTASHYLPSVTPCRSAAAPSLTLRPLLMGSLLMCCSGAPPRPHLTHTCQCSLPASCPLPLLHPSAPMAIFLADCGLTLEDLQR